MMLSVAGLRLMLAAIIAATGVRRLDYSANPHFNKADFLDSDHLNKTGAVKMTRLLMDDLNRAP